MLCFIIRSKRGFKCFPKIVYSPSLTLLYEYHFGKSRHVTNVQHKSEEKVKSSNCEENLKCSSDIIYPIKFVLQSKYFTTSYSVVYDFLFSLSLLQK